MWLLVAADLLMLAWIVSTSLREHGDIFADPIGLPTSPVFENYTNAWSNSDFGLATVNSVVITVATIVLLQLIASPAGYALARSSSRAAGPLQLYFVLGLGVPMQVLIVPLFALAAEMGLTNTHLGLILVYTATHLPFTIYLMTAFFKALPTEVEEAAGMDGAGPIRSFFQVSLPLVRSGIVTSIILNVIGIWNETFIALVFVQSSEVKTLPLALYGFMAKQQYSGADYGQLFAGITIIILPMLLLYLWLGRRIISGMTLGAVK